MKHPVNEFWDTVVLHYYVGLIATILASGWMKIRFDSMEFIVSRKYENLSLDPYRKYGRTGKIRHP